MEKETSDHLLKEERMKECDKEREEEREIYTEIRRHLMGIRRWRRRRMKRRGIK